MYLVSACLAGYPCRYDGKTKPNEKIIALVASGKALPVCPEQLGELSTPRRPCEIINGKVLSKDSLDLTEQYRLGARRTLAICKAIGIDKAILKSKSPACGFGIIHDGSFSNACTNGNGITADLLFRNGIKIMNEINFNL